MNQTVSSSFQRLRAQIESGFSRWGEISATYPWRIVLTALVVIAFFASFLPNMTVDMSTEGYLHENDPARLVYDEFQVEFGRDERLILLLQSDHGLLTPQFLERLRSLHRRLEALPHVEKVDSLYNARRTYGQDDALIVRDLLEDWPESAADFAALREIIESSPLYRKLFVNATLDKTLLIVTPNTFRSDPAPASAEALDDFDFSAGFESDLPAPAAPSSVAEREAEFLGGDAIFELINTLKTIATEESGADFHIGLAGSPYMMHQLTYILGRDMFKFSFIGIFVIGLLLYLIFRRLVMVFLPVTIASASLFFTFALIAFLGKPVTTAVQILPSLLLAVGVGNSVHIFSVFFQAIERGQDKKQALAYALGHSGFAVVMTGLTTAGGLVSFISADMKPVSDIGIVSPLGILSTLMFSILLLPALIALSPIKSEGLHHNNSGWIQRFLQACARISTRHPRRMVLAWFSLIGLSLILVAQIVPSHYPLNWFAPDSDLRASTEIIDAEFDGATYIEIVVDSGEENGLHDPELLHAVDEALRFMAQLEVNGVQIRNASSLLDISKELHQALHGNDPAYYRIPDERALIAQELLLFENSGSDDLDDIVDSAFRKMRVTLRAPFVDGVLYPEYLEVLEGGVREIIGARAEVTFTGIVNLLSRTVRVLIGDTIRAYLLAFLIISGLMMLMVGSVRTGLISMIPNLAPIIITLALMALLKIPLDAFTLLIGSIALGLAVDDTIHFMHNYQRYYARYGDSEKAVMETLNTTGRALLITSVVLSASFFVNIFGEMINLQNFGLLTSFCIIVAFFADALLAPALVTLLSQFKQKGAHA